MYQVCFKSIKSYQKYQKLVNWNASFDMPTFWNDTLLLKFEINACSNGRCNGCSQCNSCSQCNCCSQWIVSLSSAGLQKGLFPIGITSIEKRFGFESWMTGLLFTTYDIGFILSSLFVTYNLRNMGVPRIIAWALVLFSVGSLLFALPHFLTDLYQYTSTDREGKFALFWIVRGVNRTARGGFGPKLSVTLDNKLM